MNSAQKVKPKFLNWAVSSEDKSVNYAGVDWVIRLLPQIPVVNLTNYESYNDIKMNLGSIHCSLAALFHLLEMDKILVNKLLQVAPEHWNSNDKKRCQNLCGNGSIFKEIPLRKYIQLKNMNNYHFSNSLDIKILTFEKENTKEIISALLIGHWIFDTQKRKFIYVNEEYFERNQITCCYQFILINAKTRNNIFTDKLKNFVEKYEILKYDTIIHPWDKVE